MKITNWNRFPVVEAAMLSPQTESDLNELLSVHDEPVYISRGLGRSYGDASLGKKIISCLHLDHFISYDSQQGLIRCQSGTSLSQILQLVIKDGWFLPVTPGTKFVTVGGAVASDVHGKNHHCEGCFSGFVDEIRLMLSTGETITCSMAENKDLFIATCGGMGLTGIILEVALRLKKIRSPMISALTLRSSNLTETLALLDEYNDSTYSVAWLDCLSKKEKFGRGLVMLGEHSSTCITISKHRSYSLPTLLPSFLLNKYTAGLFNVLYYSHGGPNRRHDTSYESFFYPLDAISNWNEIYGSNGFIQYQFVIPYSAGRESIERLLHFISTSGHNPYLAVLKLFGEENENLLSFPMAGYTLALDFKIVDGIFSFLDKLDDLVLEHCGRIYLAKDARMKKEIFKSSYPDWEQFNQIRYNYNPVNTFTSVLSQRLGL